MHCANIPMGYVMGVMETNTADRIRIARERAGLNRNQAALALGVSWQHYDSWENGKRNPTAESLRKVAEVFGVSLDELVGLTEQSGQSSQELDAWLEEASALGVNPTQGETAWMRSMQFPPGVDPSSALYGALLGTLRLYTQSSR